MRCPKAIVVVAALFISGCPTKKSPPSRTTSRGKADTAKAADAASRSDRWRSDLRQLTRTLETKHIKPFHRISRAELRRRGAAIAKQMPKLSDTRIALRFSALIASMGDAHTRIALPKQPLVPLALYAFDDGVHVVAIDHEHGAAIGGRVTMLGGVSIDELMKGAAALVAADNSAGRKLEAAHHLVLVDVLLALGGKLERGKVTLRVEGRDRKLADYHLAPVDDLRGVRWRRPTFGGKPPLRLQKPQLNYWNTYLAPSQTVYFKYNRCADNPGSPMRRFAPGMLAFIDQRRPKRVVVDLRGNRGGNSLVLRPLIDGLAARRKRLGFALAAIVDRAVFSSALLNALELKERAGATIIGEPTSGKPNHFGEIKTFRLKYSKLGVQYSTKYFRKVKGDPDSLVPDIRIRVDAKDVLSGKDVALAAALLLK